MMRRGFVSKQIYSFSNKALFGLEASSNAHQTTSTAAAELAYWASLESVNPMPHRDAHVKPTVIGSTADDGSTAFSGISAQLSRQEAQRIWGTAGMTFINNCEAGVADPNIGQNPTVNCSTVKFAGDDALVWGTTDATKVRNIKWRVAKYANTYPTLHSPWSIFHPANEPDLNGNRFCAYSTIAGQTVSQNTNQDALNYDELHRRMNLIQQSIWEELKSTSRLFCTSIHPAAVALAPITSPGITPTTARTFGMADLVQYNGGEILNYCNCIAFHFHNYPSAFNSTNSTSGERSLFNLWTHLKTGQTLAGLGQVHPIYCDEGGIRETGLAANQQTIWNSTDSSTNLTARRNLRERRHGMLVVQSFYWSVSLWCLYSHDAGSEHSYTDGSPSYTPLPAFTFVGNICTPSTYFLPPGPVPIVARQWTEFHDPRGWVILGDFYFPEKADPASTSAATWYEWDRATISNNAITFTAPTAGQGNQRNRACRCIILPGHSSYIVKADFTGSTGRATLVARGYNLLDGLDDARVSSTGSSGTLYATFTTVPHTNAAITNTPKFAIVLESTNPVTFSNVYYYKVR